MTPTSSDAPLTVAMCTRNRADRYLWRALDSLLAQTADRSAFRILVIDNGSRDGTAALLQRYADEHPGHIGWVHEPEIGISFARNRGIAEAQTELVAFLDDDAVAEPGWVSAILRAWAAVDRGRTAAIGGPVRLGWEAPRPRWMVEGLDGILGAYDPGGPARTTDRLNGGNVSYARQAVLEIGGFTNELGRAGGKLIQGEDDDMHTRLRIAGHTVRYEPAMSVVHAVSKERLDPAYFLRWAIGSGVAFADMRRRLTQARGPVPAPVVRVARIGRLTTRVGRRLIGAPFDRSLDASFERSFLAAREVSEILATLGLDKVLRRFL